MDEPFLRKRRAHPSQLNGLAEKVKWVFSPATLARKQSLADALRMEEDGSEGAGLSKVLSVWDLLAYGVAFTVGAGIFVTIGTVAKEIAGPAIVFSFVAAGVAALLSAFCYAEFSARIPVCGSAYSFAYVSLGEFVAWLIGWNLTLEYAASGSAVARGWAGYVVNFLRVVGVDVPYWLHNWVPSEAVRGIFSFSILSYVIIAICTIILLFGAKKSSTFNNIITLINLAVILFIIILGSIHVNTANWENFFPYGFGGIFRGAGTVFFAYIGFDSITTLASETKNPKRDVPIGIIGTLIISTLLYVAVSLAVTGMVPYYSLDLDSPLAAAFESYGLHWAAGIIAVGSVTTLTATTLASLLSQPRIFMQMAADGLFFKKFLSLSSTQIPIFGTLVTGYGAGVLALCMELNSLTDMISIGTLMAFSVVCGGVILLRLRPDDNTPTNYAWCRCFEGLARIIQPNAVIVLTVYTLLVIGFGISVKEGLPMWVWFIFAGLAFLCYLALQVCRHQSIPAGFKAPLVPLLPLVGMAINIYFITQLPYGAILRVLAWSSAGCLIYFFYGAWNSRLNAKLLESEQIEEDNASVSGSEDNSGHIQLSKPL